MSDLSMYKLHLGVFISMSLLILFVGSFTAWGQTTIWDEDFELYSDQFPLDGSSYDWVITGTSGGNSWAIYDPDKDLTTTQCLEMYTGSTDRAYDNSQAANEIAYYDTEIDASDYENLTLDFDWACGGDENDYFMLVYSTNSGSTWSDVSSTKYYGETASWQSVSDLDLSACDANSFLIGFRWINNSSGGDGIGLYIDNISIKGTEFPDAPSFHNTGSSSQLAFNNSKINDNTPIFRVSATHDDSFDRFQVEINTESDFSGTAYTQTFSGTYSSGNAEDLECNSLSTSLPTTDGVTYYVRVRASDGGTNYGAWSTDTYSFTYKSSGDVDWHQTTDTQFETCSEVEEKSEADIGNTGSYSGNHGTGWHTYALFQKVTVTETRIVSSLSVYLHAAAGDITMALYEDAGSKNKLVESSEASASTGWNELSISETEISAGDYWIAIMVSSSSTNIGYTTGSGNYGYYESQTYATFPANAASFDYESSTNYMMYLTLKAEDNTITSPAIQYASFDGASGWDELTWTSSGTGTVEVGVYSDASCSTELIAPEDDGSIDLSTIDETTETTLYLQATLTGASPSLDDWTVTCNFDEPLISVGSLTAFDDECTGETSAEKSYTVSGSNLTADIVITPPANFEISTTSGSGFVANPSTITLTQSGGTVSSTTIYVRFKPTSVQSYSGNITHTSTGATTKNVAVSGDGVDSEPIVGSPSSASITSSSATIGGNATDIGCSSITERGVYYSTSDGFTPPGQGTKVSSSGTFGTGAFNENLSGLTPNQTYYFKAFATNDGGTGYSAQSSFTTDCGAPTTQASNVSFSSVTDNSMTISWDRGATPGDGVIVVVKAGSAVDSDPVNGTSYTANTAFSSGTQIGTGNYVVFLASGTSVSVTGLSANTTYHVAVYEKNCSGASSVFNTTSPATGSQLTLCSTPSTQASSVSFSSVTDNSMTINWTRGGTPGDGVIVLVKEGSAVNSNPSDGSSYTADTEFGDGSQIGTGNYVVFLASGTSVTVTGLSASTTYHVAVYEKNCSGSQSAFNTSSPATGSQETECAPYSIPFFEGFETYSGHNTDITTLNTCYSAGGSGTIYLSDNDGDANNGENCLKVYYSNEPWLFIQISVVSGVTYDFSMYAYRANGYEPAYFTVKYGNSASSAAMTNTIVAETEVVNANYVELSNTFTASSTGNIYIGIFSEVKASSSDYYYFDDIYIEALPDEDSEAEAPGTQIAAANIASTVDTDGEAQEVFKFSITDQGTSDGEVTDVTNIRIKPGSGNTADWTDNIQNVKLYDNDGASFVTIGSPTITDTYIDIPISSGNLEVSDGSSISLSLYVYLNTSNVADGDILDFRIDYDDHGFTAHADGSGFADEFGASDIEGNNQTITVTATTLSFESGAPDSTEPLSQNFDVTVNATDANGNIDVDASGNVALSKNSGSGTLSSATGLTQALSSGSYTWIDVQYNSTETCPSGLTITASHSGALTSVTTSCIAIESGPEAFDITTSNGEGCGGGNVSIEWDASTNATSYDLYWCNTSGCNPADGDNIITGVTSPYSFAISDNGATYQVRILAKNSADEHFSNNVFVYNTYSTGTWIGGTSTDWSNTANWCGGSVPDCEDEIIIMAGASFNPVLTESVSVGSITIESGASLGLGSYTMTVYGDITLDNSTLTAGTGTIQFANSGCATAPGTHNFDPGDNTLNDFTINTDYVYIVNNDLKLSGDLTITDGTLDANGNDLEIGGNWTNYSLFVPGTGTVTFNGSGNSTIIKDGPEVVVYATSFEDSDLGTLGWSLGKVPGKTEWRRQSGTVSGDRLAPADGTYDLALYDLMDSEPGYAYDGTTDHNSYVDAQKKIDLTDVSSADISFKWYCHGTGTDEFTGVFLADGVEIDDALYNMDGGSNPIVPTSWTTETESLDAYCNKEVQLTFRMFLIKYSSTSFPSDPGDYGFAIDDIEITGTESAESFNNLVINKSGGTVFFDDGTDSKVNVMGDITISSGTLNVQGNFLRCFGDFTNDGTFTHGTDGEIIFKGDGDQTISGTSDVAFEKLRIDKTGDLYVGHASVAGFDVTVNDTLIWADNDNNLIIGNGATASLSLPGDLTVRNGCGFETANGSTIAMKGHYVNYGTYTPNNGKVLLNGDRDSYIIKEPSEILYYEGFETDDGGFTLGGNSNESFVRSSGSAHNSNYDIALEATTQNVPYDYLYGSSDDITAEITIDLTGYETAELQFWWRCAGEDGADYGQLYVNDNLLMDNMHGHTFYTQSPRFDISEYANGEVTLKFRWQDDGSGGNSPGLCFDDILITGTSINQETFYNLEVNKDASNDNYALLRCPIDVDNNMTILNGHLDSGGISFPVGGNWTNDNSSYFEHKNNAITFDGNNDDKDQVITNNGENNFYNIIIDNTGNDISLEGERLYIENDLDIDAGNLDANTEDIMIEGDWTNGGGTFDASNTTVYFRGDIDQQVISDGDAFYNLTLPLADDPTAGDPAKDNAVIMNDNLTINKNIKLSAGALDTDDTYNIDIKGNWYNEGGGFIHPNDATTEVKFSGTGMQKVNVQSDDSRYEANFSFDNVVIDGADVRFYVDSDNYLLLSRNLTINATKIFKLIQNTP